jgi:hypothetical protein
MAKFTNSLKNVKIAAPCSADWGAMTGNDRVRFCGQCNLNVYNLSDMTQREAESLISSSEGKLCARYYRRGDGTVLTNDCPVGIRAMARRVKRISAALISAVIGFCTGVGTNNALQGKYGERRDAGTVMGTMVAVRHLPEPPSTSVDPVTPYNPGNALMGGVAVDVERGAKSHRLRARFR